MKPKTSIELFLQLAKLIVRNRGIIFVPSKESKAFIEDNGLATRDVIDIILRLTTRDCFDGPEADRDQAKADYWTVAEFNPLWRSKRLYLKISINLSAKRCKCLSIKPYLDTWEILDGAKDI